MEKLCVLFVFALVCSEALSLTLKHRRQAPNDNNDPESNLDDRYGFDNFQLILGGQRPGRLPCRGINCQVPSQPQVPQQTTSTSAPGSTTMSPAYQSCVARCPVTAEYNPVCGSDNVTYDNPGRLYCAQQCGQSITLLRSSRCAAPAAN